MELKTNSNHKKLDLRSIDKAKLKKINIALSSIVISISLLSGCSIGDNQEAKYEQITPEESVEKLFEDTDSIQLEESLFSVEFDDDRVIEDNMYTREDLKHITEAVLMISDDSNCDYINYMTNLKRLEIIDFSESNVFKHVDGSRFNKGISITIDSSPGGSSFNEEKYGFLKDIPVIDTLVLGYRDESLNLDSDFVQELHNVKNLTIGLDAFSNFEYKDLTYLESLNLDGEPYTVPMHFTNSDLDELENSGVKVTTMNMEKVREVNSKIDEYVSSLNLDEDATDEEKLNAVLAFVLENLEYDTNMANKLAAGEPTAKENEYFYREGTLTAAFEDDSQICGTYMGDTTACSKRLGLETYNVTSADHAWNVIKIGDYYYHVDPTWLDDESVEVVNKEVNYVDGKEEVTTTSENISSVELLKSNDQEKLAKLDWYMRTPESISEEDESHRILFYPQGLEIAEVEPIEEIVVPAEEEFSKSQFEIVVNNKKYVIGGAALIGILSGLGIGSLRRKKKEKERELRRMRRDSYDFYSNSPYYSDINSKKY